MIVESIPEQFSMEESEMQSVIEREKDEKRNRDSVIKQFKRID
jgi:pseudouridine-5'-phosphate glycosidase